MIRIIQKLTHYGFTLVIGLGLVCQTISAGPAGRMRVLMSHIYPDGQQIADIVPDIQKPAYEIYMPLIATKKGISLQPCDAEEPLKEALSPLNLIIFHQMISKENGFNRSELRHLLNNMYRGRTPLALLISEPLFLEFVSSMGLAACVSFLLPRWKLLRTIKARHIFYLLVPREYINKHSFRYELFEDITETFLSDSINESFLKNERTTLEIIKTQCSPCESSKESLCSLFVPHSGSWNISLVGHGRRLPEKSDFFYCSPPVICEFTPSELGSLLKFFNTQLYVNIFSYGSCYSGGKNFHEAFKELLLTFPVINFSLGNFPSGKTTPAIPQIDHMAFFNSLQNIELTSESIACAARSAFSKHKGFDCFTATPQLRLPQSIQSDLIVLRDDLCAVVKKEELEAYRKIAFQKQYKLIVLESDTITAPLVIHSKTKLFFKKPLSRQLVINNLIIRVNNTIDLEGLLFILAEMFYSYPFEGEDVIIKELNIINEDGIPFVLVHDVMCKRYCNETECINFDKHVDDLLLGGHRDDCRLRNHISFGKISFL